ncbi:hypothetical protein GCM10010254_23550 [Streptomyces chromofuscus]|nr:hypothetical protein GCM10010254_23550 [Streptomyces chromofuscus]
MESVFARVAGRFAGVSAVADAGPTFAVCWGERHARVLNEALSAYDTDQVTHGDTWISLGPHTNVARVLLLPDDLQRGPHADDFKDDDGHVALRRP